MKKLLIALFLVPFCVFGAETISTLGSTGKDFSTLQGWITAQEGDITAGNAEVAECYDTGAAIAASATGTWVTDSDSYWSIRAAAGEETDGISAGATFTGNIFTDITSGSDNVRIKDLTILIEGNQDAIDVSSTGTDILIERNIFDGQGNVQSQQAVIDINAAATIILRNCIFLANDSTATDAGHGVHMNTSGTITIDNCTFIGWDDGVENDGGTITCQNVITYNCTDGFDEGGGTITKTTCISDISGDANTQTTQEAADLFTLPGSTDFSVKDTGSDLRNAGTDLSGTFTQDIIRFTRVGTWDVGAFELQEAVSTTLIRTIIF